MMDIQKEVADKLVKLHGDRVRFLGLNLVKKPGKGSYKMLRLVCSKHGPGEQRQDVALKGSLPRCCVGEQIARSKRPDFLSNIERVYKVHGDKYLYLKFSYGEPDQQKVSYLCPEHGLVEQLLGNHAAGKGCNKCSSESRGRGLRVGQEDSEARAKLVHNGLYSYLPNLFEMGKTWMRPVCPKHGAFKQRLYDHLSGKGCSKCQPPVSKLGSSFVDALEAAGITLEREKRLGRYTVDAYIPSAKLAVEFDGLWFHSDAFRPDFAMRRKQEYLKSEGVRSIHIFEDEWLNKPEVVLALVKNACIPSQSIGARKTQVKQVAWVEARAFLNKYHIQGASRCGNCYGLYQGEELLAVAAFSQSTSDRRAKKSDTHAELVRFASKLRVVGGLSKLVAAYLNNKPNIKTIVSFSDNRLFEGRAYEKTGFERVKVYSSDYYYMKGSKRYLKTGFQKSKLYAAFPDLPTGKTERELALLKGFRRLYDSGKTKWLYTVKSPPDFSGGHQSLV